jgi:hypothetical protein
LERHQNSAAALKNNGGRLLKSLDGRCLLSSNEYATNFNQDSRQCPICRTGQLDGSQAAYLTHLALEHEQVMKYVQAAVGVYQCCFTP